MPTLAAVKMRNAEYRPGGGRDGKPELGFRAGTTLCLPLLIVRQAGVEHRRRQADERPPRFADVNPIVRRVGRCGCRSACPRMQSRRPG
jgi:hypothetical protein